MKDTGENVERIYREMLMKRSGAERLKMGADMFDASKKLARAGLESQASCSETDMKARLFVRFYGNDFPRETLSRILAHLRASPIRSFGRRDIEAAILRNDCAYLVEAAVAISLHSPELEWAQSVCVELSRHPHFNVRGNAVLAFGVLARRFGRLDEATIKPILEAALRDENEFVRGQAVSAADDVRQYLHWRVATPDDR